MAVVAGDGLAAIFREFGVAAVVQGGQSANPSTGELLEAIEARRRARDPAPAQQPERHPGRAPGRPDDRPPGRRRPDPERGRRASPRCSRSIPALGAAANAAPDDRGGPGDPDPRRHRGGPRRDDRRQEGQARPDDRARPRRWARRRRTATGTSACSAAVASLTPGFELLTLFYGDGCGPGRGRGDGPDPGSAIATGVEVEVRHGGQPLLPLPDRRRVAVAKAASRSAAADRPGRAPGDPARAVRPAAAATAAPGRDPARLLRRSATCCSTCRAGTTTCARCASSATCSCVEDGDGRSRPRRRVGDVRVEPGFRGRTQRTIARLEDDTGAIDATWFGRRFIERRLHGRRHRSWCPGRSSTSDDG